MQRAASTVTTCCDAAAAHKATSALTATSCLALALALALASSLALAFAGPVRRATAGTASNGALVRQVWLQPVQTD